LKNLRTELERVLINCAGSSLTNDAFGGSRRRTLFATKSVTGSALRATPNSTGLPINRAIGLPRSAGIRP